MRSSHRRGALSYRPSCSSRFLRESCHLSQLKRRHGFLVVATCPPFPLATAVRNSGLLRVRWRTCSKQARPAVTATAITTPASRHRETSRVRYRQSDLMRVRPPSNLDTEYSLASQIAPFGSSSRVRRSSLSKLNISTISPSVAFRISTDVCWSAPGCKVTSETLLSST